MILRVVGHSSELMDGTEREREKKIRFVVGPIKYVFLFFLFPASSRPSVMDGPSPGPSCEGANPSPSVEGLGWLLRAKDRDVSSRCGPFIRVDG